MNVFKTLNLTFATLYIVIRNQINYFYTELNSKTFVIEKEKQNAFESGEL